MMINSILFATCKVMCDKDSVVIYGSLHVHVCVCVQSDGRFMRKKNK